MGTYEVEACTVLQIILAYREKRLLFFVVFIYL